MKALASGGQPNAVLVRIQALRCFPTEFRVDGDVGKRLSAGCPFDRGRGPGGGIFRQIFSDGVDPARLLAQLLDLFWFVNAWAVEIFNADPAKHFDGQGCQVR